MIDIHHSSEVEILLLEVTVMDDMLVRTLLPRTVYYQMVRNRCGHQRNEVVNDSGTDMVKEMQLQVQICHYWELVVWNGRLVAET